MLNNKTSMKVIFFGLLIIVFSLMASFVLISFSESEQTASAATYTSNGITFSDVSGGLNVDSYSGTATSVTIPETYSGKRIVSISQTAFNNKTTLTSISIPRYVVMIGAYISTTGVTTFDGCTNLTTITVAAGNNYYKSDAGVLYSIDDKGVPITLICYPRKKTGTSYTVLTGTRYIGAGAFNSNAIITTLVLPTTLTDIGNFAFDACTLLANVKTTVDYTIPASVNFIGDFAFRGCAKITSMNIAPAAPQNFYLGQSAFLNTGLPKSGNIMYSTGNKWIVGTIANISGALTIPNTVVGIGSGAFAGRSISSVAFASTPQIVYIGSGAFNSCLNLTSVTLPTSLRHIGSYAFANNRNASFTSISLPSGLLSIGEGAFYSCWKLSTFSIPTSVTNIGYNAFGDTAAYTSLANNSLFNKSNWILGYKGSIASPSFASVVGIAERALSGTNIATADLPATVKYIGKEAFKNCTSLTTLKISANVQEIAPYAFSGCTNLYILSFNNGTGSGTKKIGDYAFYQSSTVTNCSVILPSTITEIGEYAFYKATKISSLDLGSVVTIGDYAFQDCTAITTLSIPSTVQTIGKLAFYNTGFYNSAANGVVYVSSWALGYKGDKSAVASLTLNNGTKGIASLAFNNMPALTTVVLPDTLVSIGDHAFYMSYSLSQVMLKRTYAQGGTQVGLGVYNNIDLAQLDNYVKPDSVTGYKSMANWSTLSLPNTISAFSNVTVSSGSGGSVTGTSGYYFPGDSVAVSATPTSAYFFSGWSVGGTTKDRNLSYSYPAVAGDITLLGNFSSITTANRTETYAKTPYTVSFSPGSPYTTAPIIYKSGSQVISAPSNVGSYTAQIDVKYDTTTVGTKTVTITINKKAITAKATDTTLTYGDALPTFGVTYTGVVSGDSLTDTVTTNYARYNNVGNYTLTVTPNTYANYTANYQVGTLTVNKKAVTIKANNAAITYGSAPPSSFTMTYTGLVNGDTLSDAATVNYSQYDNAGSYTISVTPKTYTNYAPTYQTGVLTVNKKAVTIKADDKSVDYGSNAPTFTFAYTGLVNNDTLTDTATTNYSKGNNVGTYTITVTNKTYTNYTGTYQTGTLTVNRIAAVISGTNPQSYEYNGTVRNLAATLNHAETPLTYSPQQGYKDYGSYSITVSAAQSTNYFAVSSTFTLNITRRTLIINADEIFKQYGDDDPEITFTETGLIAGDTITGKLSRSSGPFVGDYNIYIGTLRAGDNYIIEFNTNIFHITRRAIQLTAKTQSKVYGTADPVFGYDITAGSIANDLYPSGTLTRVAGEGAGEYDVLQGTVTNDNNPNYDITFVSRKFTITKRPLGITVSSASKTYGESDPEFPYEITSGSLLSGDSLTGSISREAGNNAGDYLITLGTLNNNNYSLSLNVAIFSIYKKSITAKADNKTIIYGDAFPTFTVSYTGLVGGDTLTDVVTTQYKRYDNIGTFALTVTPNTYTNYTATYSVGTLTVNKRSVTIKADNKSITYGDEPPVYTISYTGLVNGDVLNDTVSASYEQYGASGSYVITVAPNTYTNYTGVYQTGTLTVNDKKISISGQGSKTYGDTDPVLTYSIVLGDLVSNDTLTGSLARAAGENAGNYNITIGTLNNDNYEITLVPSLFIIHKKNITIKANDASVTYGDVLPAFTATYTGLVGSDSLTDTVTTTYTRYADVGSFTLTVTPKTYTNYSATYQTGTLTVNKKAVTIKADNKSITYGDNPPAYTVSYTGLVNGDTLSDTASAPYSRYGNSGSYTISVAPKTYTNYTGSYQTGTLTVNKKTATVTAQNKSITYGEDIPVFTFTYTGLVNNDTLTDTASTPYVRYGDVGSYAITVNAKTHTNYILTSVAGQLNVGKKALTVVVDDLTIEYGSPVPVFTFTYVGLENNDELGDEAYTDYVQYAAVDTYYIRIKDNTYTNYSASFVNGVLTVIKATGRLDGDTVQTHIYDGTLKLLDVTLNHSQAEMSFSPTQGYTLAGSYQIIVTVPETVNYTAVNKEFTLSIQKRELRVTVDPQEKTYGESDPALTYTYTNLLAEDTITGSLVRAAGEDVGSYNISAGTVSAGINYVTVLTSANLVINARPLTVTAHAASKIYGYDDPIFEYTITSGNLVSGDTLSGSLSRAQGIFVGKYEMNIGTLNNSNYAITFVPEYLTINKRPITIKADDMSKIYGDTDPELSYSFISGSLAYEDTISAAVARAEGEDVGVYPISIVQSENSSYDITYQGNSFTINRRPITISAEEKTKIYGYIDPEFTYTVSEGNLAFEDTLSGELTRATGENKGSYEILRGSITNENNKNYDISYVPNALDITARPLILAAVDKQKTYGDSDPVLEYVFEDGELAFSDALAGVIARETGENVNSYIISRGTLTSANNPNYDISFNDGVFLIIRRNITVSARPYEKTYGYNEPPLPYDVTEGNLVGSDKLSGLLARPAIEDVGSYPITQGTVTNENNPNYNITFVGNTFVINKRPITITANSLTRAYGDPDPVLSYTVTTGSLGFADRLSGAAEREPGENLGEYTIRQGTLTNENNTNYVITFVEGKLTIIQRSIIVSANSYTKIYGDADPDPTYEITSGKMAFDEQLVGALARVSGENVGLYTIYSGSINTANNPNYIIFFENGLLTIDRRPISITPDALSKIYGYEDPQFTYEITSGNLVFDDALQGKLSRVAGENVNRYDIISGTLNNDNNKNYNITLVEEQFEITQRLIVIIADAKNKIYGNHDPEFTYGLYGGTMVPGDKLSGELSRQPGEDTGAYAITMGSLSNPNYEIVIVAGNLLIQPRPITITANSMSFLHGSADSIDLVYTITGEPLPEDEELIASAVSITSSAKPDSYVGNYPIYLNQIRPLNNYTVTMINSVLRILKGEITDVYFNDLKVLYDGYEQILTATGDVYKYTVEYKNNAGTEVGVYRATAIFTKENYNDLILEAKLVIMTNTIATSEIIPQGIITIESGVDPYVVPVIVNNNDIRYLEQAEELIVMDKDIGESVKNIMNISLYSNGTTISLDGTAEVRMLIPSTITDLSTLRIAFMGEDTIYDVAYEIDGEYIIFTAHELGNYAFITESHEVTQNDRVASVLLYVGVAALLIVLVGFIAAGFTVKRRKRDHVKYI